MYNEFCILASFSCYKVTRPLIIEQKYVSSSSELYVGGKFGKQNGLFIGVTRDFLLQSHFHVGVHR